MYRGEKVILRELRGEEVSIALGWFNDYEVRRYAQNRVAYPFTMADEKGYYESISGMKDTYTFAIETLEGVYIGNCGVNSIDWKNSRVVIGIVVGEKDHWGKGYGTDAMKVLLNFIYNEMNINKVELAVYGYNERAIACYKKCGFVEEGRVRQAIFREGRYFDEVLMGLLRSEWQERS